MKPNKNPERYELVASVTRYTGREDFVEWLRRFPTKYKGIKFKETLEKARSAKMLLWTLEDVWDRKSRECFAEEGVTVL